ncbi:MAG TPA: FAD-dependent oxidoreductase [Terriglobales bacterium]|jgi:sarcosine oxidase|nr:FAD-dependent oxidoreductase [Terriglobales bacterium]
MRAGNTDFVVIGAGVFGVWTAHALRSQGHSVMLIDAHGAGNNRSSSGDESRIIRMGYGADALYTRWATRSLRRWRALFHATGQTLFVNTGVLWLSSELDRYTQDLLRTLATEGIPYEELSTSELTARFPQINVDDVAFGILEPESGVLLARRAVQAVLDDAIRLGVQYAIDAVAPLQSANGNLAHVRTRSGEDISGGTFVFSCGAWLPQLFPELLGSRIFPTRQEVFYFGTPPGARGFKPPRMPVWLHHQDDMYGLPDIENRGIKVASDRHGEPFDPETGDRTVSESGEQEVRAYLCHRFPWLKRAPLTETRVCQYENTSNGDFLIDRHPDIENVWLVGGGSGHGFKHGPAVGEYLVGRILETTPPETRFLLMRKRLVQQRTVY